MLARLAVCLRQSISTSSHNPALGRFLSADPVQPCPEGSQPGTQGHKLYAYVANNPTSWVDPSGFSALPHNVTPGQAAIMVGMLVSLPAAVTLGGLAGVFLLSPRGAVLRHGVDYKCSGKRIWGKCARGIAARWGSR
jgi:hypothetical protein